MTDNEAKQLLVLIAAGDHAAFDKLYRAYARLVYKYARHKVRSDYWAEAIVSDTFLQVWLSAKNFRGESPPTTWLIGIARFKILEAISRGDINNSHESIDDYTDLLSGSDDDTNSARRIQDRLDIKTALKEADMTPEQRECIVLFYYVGLSVEEIAIDMECPVNTVKSRLYLGRKHLKDFFDGNAGTTK